MARDMGLSTSDADSTYNLLPRSLQNSMAFFDQLSRIWRYDYGVPHKLKSGIIIGYHQYPIVSVLLRGIRRVHEFLPNEKFIEFSKRLENRSKHFDFLSELDPVIRLDQGFQIIYEPSGYARGNRRIDWLIIFDDGSQCLVDVKNRVKPIIKLGQTALDQSGKNADLSKEVESAKGIFKSSEIKFLPQKKNILQGVWVRIDVFVNQDELHEEFSSLDPKLVQFAVLTTFDSEAVILARNLDIKNWVKQRFNLRETKN